MLAPVLWCPACATLPRDATSEAQLRLYPKVENARPVNINVASATELEELPGVGKVIAERIIAHRAEYGPFRRAEHLIMVGGISDRKFRAIRSMIVVE